MKKRLVTSALPYVNNIPHLGNLIQCLSGDVFARFCRSYGYETRFICGTDEYGTATETKAAAEGVSPRELCDKYHEIHRQIYDWFEIHFDHFGRTSSPKQTEIVQHIFKKVDEAGYVAERTTTQLFCEHCDRFLADRYVGGTCPHCGYEEARGDQCEKCGKLLDPTDLISPKCGSCGSQPVLRETKHLYLDLPKALPLLESWMEKRSVEGFWAKNALAMTKGWIRDGLKERCITRDLKWGIPVPKPGYENKVFYVWFDAPIGYVSITASKFDDWKEWWYDPDNTELYQFIGKDNIPFHTVIFPSCQLATGENWTTLYHMSSTEYLNYENGKFSKSKGTGVFGDQAKETGIPADVWRFYIFYNRPEKSDVQFLWSDFRERVNSQLIGNFGNLINRTVSFIRRFYDGNVPEAPADKAFLAEEKKILDEITRCYDRADLRDAFRGVFELTSFGNKAFQDGEPWRTRKEAPEEAARLIRSLINLIHDAAVVAEPVLPATAAKIAEMLGVSELKWENLQKSDIRTVGEAKILFTPLEEEQIDELRVRYGGAQTPPAAVIPDSQAQKFADAVRLAVGRIESIETHPNADKLYVEQIDLGSFGKRQIVSGLADFYRKEELVGKKVIVAVNLKPAKLRGVLSEGMILAAECGEGDGKQIEVLSVDAPEGTVVVPENTAAAEPPQTVKIDRFFEVPLTVEEGAVKVGGERLKANSVFVETDRIRNGRVC